MRYKRGVAGHAPDSAVIGLDPRNVAVFNQFLDQARTKIVVTSSWRWNHSLSELQQLLVMAGVKGEVIGATKRRSMANRGLEIQDWLDTNEPLRSFVILDDSADMGHLAPKLVQTSMDTGLREKHVPLALKILSESFASILETKS